MPTQRIPPIGSHDPSSTGELPDISHILRWLWSRTSAPLFCDSAVNQVRAVNGHRITLTPLRFLMNPNREASLAPEQRRKNWSYLELQIPFRAIDLGTDGVILDLCVEFHGKDSHFMQLSHLQAYRKCQSVTSGSFPVDSHVGICSNAPPVLKGVDKGIIQEHMSRSWSAAAHREPLLRKYVSY